MKKILIVDDSDVFSSLLETMFGQEFEIHKAYDGVEGINRALELRPDLILLDIMMPRVSGIEVLRQLQASPETGSTPVIILTGQTLDAAMERTLQREPNVSCFLRKMDGMPVIVDAIQQVLEDAQP